MTDPTSFKVFDRAGAFVGTVRARPDGRAEAILPRSESLGLFNTPQAAIAAIDAAAKAGAE